MSNRSGLCCKQLTSAAWRGAGSASNGGSCCSISAHPSLLLWVPSSLRWGKLGSLYPLWSTGVPRECWDAGPRTRASELGHVRPAPKQPSAPVALQLEAWKDGQEHQESCASYHCLYQVGSICPTPPRWKVVFLQESQGEKTKGGGREGGRRISIKKDPGHV